MLSVVLSLFGLVAGLCGSALLAVRLGPFVREVSLAITAFDFSIHTLAEGGDIAVVNGLPERAKCALRCGQAALVWGFSLLAASFALQTVALIIRLVQEGAK